MDFLKKILGVDYHPCQGFWLYTHWLYPLKKVEVKLKEWLHRKLFPWCLVTGRWPASVWPSLILCYARVQLLVSLDFNVSTLFHCLVLNRTVSNEQQKWLQGCTSDKVHENGHNLRKMRPRTKIKPVLETRDPGLSAGHQKIQKRPSFCVEIWPRRNNFAKRESFTVIFRSW